MKFIVKKDDLLKTLNHVQSVVERRNAVPILANVRIDADKEGKLTLTTTDMDIAIQDKMTAQVKQAGAITVPAHTLFEIIRKVSENVDVELTKDKKDSSNVDLKVGSSEFTLPCLPVEEFPNFGEVGQGTHNFSIHSAVLKTLFSKTRHAISNEETRYYLNGVYLHPTTDEGTPVLRAVATDGHRLARAQTIQPEGCQDMPGIIVPKKTVGELVKLLEEYVGEVHISLSQNKIVYILGDITLSSKLIDGKFPDYDRVIPKNNDKTLEVSRDRLARSIDLVISITNDKTRAVRLNIEPSKVVVNATSEMNGNAKGAQEIDANYSSNENLSIGFNSKYVLDSLSAIEGDTVKLTLSNNLGAVIAQDTKENNCLYILMPMQV